jgi:hypothetical protein
MRHPVAMAVPDNDRDGEQADYVRVRFQLRQDDDGWSPAASEGVRAVPLGGDLVRLDNNPWFARDVASGRPWGYPGSLPRVAAADARSPCLWF